MKLQQRNGNFEWKLGSNSPGVEIIKSASNYLCIKKLNGGTEALGLLYKTEWFKSLTNIGSDYVNFAERLFKQIESSISF